jgi:predicted amidohydrolase
MIDAKIRLAQTSPALGDVAANLDQHLEAIEAARADGAGLLVFPELSLTGYFLNDLTDEVAMPLDGKVVKKIVAAAKDRAVAFGLVERARDHRLYNACVYAEKGKILHVHRKVHLPTYGIFDDGRYLAPGSAFDAFDTSFGKVGILICEDAWHMASSYLLFLQNADLILCPSASPGRGLDERGEVSSLRAWQSVLEALSQLFQTYVAYCNRVGVEDGMSFFGGSRVVDPFGSVVAQVGGLDPGAATARLEDAALRRARLFAPMRRDERPEMVLRQLRRIVGES